MTTVVNTSNPEVTTPTSYISHWIAQNHNTYQKKTNEFYSPSTIKTTTWQAQAKSRLDALAVAAANRDSSYISTININNNELQEKLHRVRALLDAKKQRLCRRFSSSSSSSSTLSDQVLSTTVVGEQSSPRPSSSVNLALENVYLPHDEPSSSILPCLIEESPSDSGFSDGTKTINNDDMIDSAMKNSAIINLNKPLCKEEMLAIIQILRELWKKQFGTEILDMHMKPIVPLTNFTATNRRVGGNEGGMVSLSNNNNNKTQYHSTPVLNKLSAELSDIKDKLKKFSSGRTIDEQPKETSSETKSNGNLIEAENIEINGENLVFIPLGAPLTLEDLERMQIKKDALIRQQMRRREEQIIKKNERLTSAIDRQSEYRLYEEYTNHRRQEDDVRRKTILQAHIEQKRFEADPPSSHDYYFAAARNRKRLKRKASMTSVVSFEDDVSFGGSTFDLISSTSGKKSIQTPKRTPTRFDYISPNLTASTSASRSKMNRAASTCNINEHYDSFTSLNSKATIPIIRPTRPAALFGGSLMNISMINNKISQQQAFDIFDLTTDSPLSGSFSSITGSTPGGSRLAHLPTKSNKQTILNSLKRVVLAGPANARQCDIVSREIQLCEARHFIILFRDHRLQFRAVYMYIPETDIIEKLYGIGPNVITEVIVEKWFKYNSGSKRFTNIPIRHFSIQCDAITIHNDFWQKKLLIHMNKLH